MPPQGCCLHPGPWGLPGVSPVAGLGAPRGGAVAPERHQQGSQDDQLRTRLCGFWMQCETSRSEGRKGCFSEPGVLGRLGVPGASFIRLCRCATHSTSEGLPPSQSRPQCKRERPCESKLHCPSLPCRARLWVSFSKVSRSCGCKRPDASSEGAVGTVRFPALTSC